MSTATGLSSARSVLVKKAVALIRQRGRIDKGTLGNLLRTECSPHFEEFQKTGKWHRILKDPRFEIQRDKLGYPMVNLARGLHVPQTLAPAGHDSLTASSKVEAGAQRPAAGLLVEDAAQHAVVVVEAVASKAHVRMLDHLIGYKDGQREGPPCSQVALDLEWAGEQLCMVQLFLPGGPAHEPTAYLLDLVTAGSQAGGAQALLGSLKPMLTDSNTLKVFHDCREVRELWLACLPPCMPVPVVACLSAHLPVVRQPSPAYAFSVHGHTLPTGHHPAEPGPGWHPHCPSARHTGGTCTAAVHSAGAACR